MALSIHKDSFMLNGATSPLLCLHPRELRANAPIALHYGFHETAFGRVLAVAHPKGLCALTFSDGDDDSAVAEIRTLWHKAELILKPETSASYVADVCADATKTIPLVLIGTDFQIRVWRALLELPSHKPISYRALATHIGQPLAARAVGGALGRNMLAITIPCHRIISAQGDMTGYRWGIERKRALLAWENTIINHSA